MVRLSTFRKAVELIREDFEMTREAHRNPMSSALWELSHAIGEERIAAQKAVLRECGIEDGKELFTTRRMELQRRVMDTLTRAAGVDWSTVYEAEEA